MLFRDEARFGRLHDARRCWAPLPLRPDVNQQLVCEFVYPYVAVSSRDGRKSFLILPWVDAALLTRFLSHAAAHYPGKHCVMLMD